MAEVVKPYMAWLKMQIGFHPSMVCCEGCPLCRTDAGYRERKRCALTEEIILFPRQKGLRCPLDFGNETDGGMEK